MKTVQVRDAKATLSRLIDAAQHGQPTIITRHGQPAAALVPMAMARKMYPADRPSLGEYLTRIPACLEIEQDAWTLRDVDL